VVLEHVLREIGDSPRERDVAVVALVLDGRAADAQSAANEASGGGLEVAFSYTCLDDVLAEVLEALGGVLRLRLLGLALTALDARRCQHGTSGVCVGGRLQCWKFDGACLLELVASRHGCGALSGLS
jgi:hypothetical protein